MRESKSNSYAGGAGLRREVGLGGAVMLGLGSMLGTGVFVGLPESTRVAGLWVLLAIVLAGGLALCNALSSAQLAARFPVAGGTYEYGYRTLSPAWGFTAGWTFLLAKTASAAAAAMGVVDTATFYVSDFLRLHTDGEYVSLWSDIIFKFPIVFRSTTVVLLILLTFAVLNGLRRTAYLNNTLLLITLLGLLVVPVVFIYGYVSVAVEMGTKWARRSPEMRFSSQSFPTLTVSEFLGVVAVTFVAFTGYGRLATLGEEVRNPGRTIPRAILITIGIVITIYLMIGVSVSGIMMNSRELNIWETTNNNKGSPLIMMGHQVTLKIVTPLIAIAAITAMLGVLLNLILGLSRVWLAMGRRGDMPLFLARVNDKTSTPTWGVVVSGALISVLVLVGDWRIAWAFSAFSVLIYYAITNAAALRLPKADRRFSPLISWTGLVSCIGLAWFVPWRVWAIGSALILLGLLWHRLRRPIRHRIEREQREHEQREREQTAHEISARNPSAIDPTT